MFPACCFRQRTYVAQGLVNSRQGFHTKLFIQIFLLKNEMWKWVEGRLKIVGSLGQGILSSNISTTFAVVEYEYECTLVLRCVQIIFFSRNF